MASRGAGGGGRSRARIRRIIWQNFVGTIAVDTMGIALAAVGLLNPLLAALIHVTSEMTFILNSARLLPAADRNPIRSAEESAEHEALANAPLRPARDRVRSQALSAANTTAMGDVNTVAFAVRSAHRRTCAEERHYAVAGPQRE